MFEALEDRRLLSTTLAPIEDVVLKGSSPLHIALDGLDTEGQDITYTAVSDNPALVSTFIPQGNQSMRITVPGHGDMVLELWEQRTPRAAGRLVDLANDDFYDGVTFHRVIDGFVIQGGDPTGTGSGGSTLGDFDDQFHTDLQHNAKGVLSWAKSTDDTNDSQFFILDGQARHLDANHSVAGFLVEGYDVLDSISAVPVTGSTPNTPVVMQTVEIFTDNENGVLMVSAPNGFFGTANITVTAEDEDGNMAQQVFNVSVQPDFDTAFELTGDTLVVEMTNGTTGIIPDGDVVADTIRIQSLTPGPSGVPAAVEISAADVGFEIVNGTWSTNPDGTRQIGPWDGGNTGDIARARWTFSGLSAGPYRVSATWPATTGGASNTPIFVLDGLGDLSPVGDLFSQFTDATDFSTGGNAYDDLALMRGSSNTPSWLEDIADVRTPTDTEVIFKIAATDVEANFTFFLDEQDLIDNGLGSEVPVFSHGDLSYATVFDPRITGDLFPGGPAVSFNETQVRVIPSNGLNGIQQITVATGVSVNAVDYQVVNIIIGEPTIQATLADITVDIDAAGSIINLDDHFDEPGGEDDLVYSDQGNTNPSLVTVSIVDGQLTLSYAAGMTGSADITIRATDPIGSFIEQTFTVNVRQVINVTDSAPDFEVVRGLWSSAGDLLFKNNGDGTSKVRWTFSDLTPGQYQVSTTWVEHSNRAVDATYSILDGMGDQMMTQTVVNQEVAPSGFNESGTEWQVLNSTFQITGDTLIIELDDGVDPMLDDGDGSFIIASSMRIQLVTATTPLANTAVVAVGDPGFNRDSGLWNSVADTFIGDIRYKFGTPAGTTSKLSWTFDVSGLGGPGTYSVATSWIAHANRATDTPFTISDGTGDHGPVTVDVNQEIKPDDFNDQGMTWETLITGFEVTGDTLIISMGDAADEFVIAGPIWIQRTGDITPPPGETPIFLEVTDLNFDIVAGAWNTIDTGVGMIRYKAAGSGSGQATWTFTGLASGQYRISTTWNTQSSSFANDAPFTLSDGAGDPTPLTVDINQEAVPNDFNDNGITWEDLAATFDVTGTELVVSLTDDSEGIVIAGTIRIQRLGDI